MARRKVTTPKAFFRAERDRFYSNAAEAFWRELFQNACDPGAGARNIAIEINAAPMRGSFEDAAPADREVVRVVFADDGKGMTQSVLDDVYFSLGETTKTGPDSTGGFGRARLMTCFANARYSILTNDRFVVGDGPDFENHDLGEAAAAAEEWRAALLAAGPPTKEAQAALVGIASDLELVRGAKAEGGYRGCRIEVDMDPEDGLYSYRRPTVERVSAALRKYLSQSQLPCKVTVNGQEPEAFFGSDDKIVSRRGPARRRIEATVDGRTVGFASVHMSEGAKAAHKGTVLVRVDGACMFTADTRADVQVIVEIDKDRSRDAMTSNRDSFRDEYQKAFEKLLQEIAIDDKSALKDNAEKGRVHIPGQHGNIRARAPAKRVDLKAFLETGEIEVVTRSAASMPTITSGLELRRQGVPEEVLRDFIRDAGNGDSFVQTTPYHERNDAMDEIADKLRWRYTDSSSDPVESLSDLSADAKGFLFAALKARLEKAEADAAAEAENKLLGDLNDVYIVMESTNPKTRKAAYRNDPRNWDVQTGKGRRARALLVAWTAACSVAAEAMMKVRPATQPYDFSTGFVYSVPENKDQGDTYRRAFSEAVHTEHEGVHYLLINPVNENGELALNPTKASDRQKMIALAIHEQAHVLEKYHNETFAGIITDVMGEIDMKEANRRMTKMVTAVYAAYESGKARVQAMDGEGGPRPAERLLAAGYPGRDTAAAFEAQDDGTSVVDCDRLQDLAPAPRAEEDNAPGMWT